MAALLLRQAIVCSTLLKYKDRPKSQHSLFAFKWRFFSSYRTTSALVVPKLFCLVSSSDFITFPYQFPFTEHFFIYSYSCIKRFIKLLVLWTKTHLTSSFTLNILNLYCKYRNIWKDAHSCWVIMSYHWLEVRSKNKYLNIFMAKQL
jgi:hypothetical protein